MKKIFNNPKFKTAAYGLLIVIFIAAVIVTIVKGINVGIYYAEGTTIKFTVSGEDISVNDIKQISDEIWDNQYVLIEKITIIASIALSTMVYVILVVALKIIKK